VGSTSREGNRRKATHLGRAKIIAIYMNEYGQSVEVNSAAPEHKSVKKLVLIE